MRIRFKGRDMRNEQQGFTLIELMIVVAIIGILSSFGMSAYQSYMIRAQVSEGLNLVGPSQIAIAEFHNENGAFPTDNTAAGLSAPGNYTGKYVTAVSVNDAVISILYGNDAHAQISGQVVTLTAADNLGSVSWACASGGVISDNHLPAACR